MTDRSRQVLRVSRDNHHVMSLLSRRARDFSVWRSILGLILCILYVSDVALVALIFRCP